MLKVKVISLPYIFQVLYVLCFTRPRYQVSVYRTIGPLVLGCFSYLQVTMTCMRAGTSSTFGLIGPPTAELDALERLKKNPKAYNGEK